MFYLALASVVVAVHLAFIAYVVVGGFVASRYRRSIVLHACAVAWGCASILVGIDCPLTALETWARVRGGGTALPSSGFIDHYLTGVIYPDSAVSAVRLLVASTVVVSWVGFVVSGSRYRSRQALRLS